MQNAEYELRRRILLPRTPVNKAKKKGREAATAIVS
jgi:hypothetical protein